MLQKRRPDDPPQLLRLRHTDEWVGLLVAVDAGAELLEPVQLALRVGQGGGDRLPLVGVVPQVRRGGLLRQVGDLHPHRRGVAHCLDRVQGVAQGADLGREVGGCHGGPGYRGADTGPLTRPWRSRWHAGRSRRTRRR